MTPAETLLNALESVREKGRGSWVARCPAHDDKSPSLSVRECDDGRVLIYCFAGCPTADVIGAVGFEYQDLFPEPLPRGHGSRKARRPRLDAWPLLRVISHRLNCICLAAEAVRRGEALSAEDWRAFDESIADVQCAIREANRVR